MNNTYEQRILNSFRNLICRSWCYELNITKDDDSEVMDSAREAMTKRKSQRGFFNE